MKTSFIHNTNSLHRLKLERKCVLKIHMPVILRPHESGSLAVELHRLPRPTFLIIDAQMPGHNIHVLEWDMKVEGGTTIGGDPEHGFVLFPRILPYFHDRCVKYLFCLVPNTQEAEKTLLGKARNFGLTESHLVISRPGTRVLRYTSHSKMCDTGYLYIGSLNQLQLWGYY